MLWNTQHIINSTKCPYLVGFLLIQHTLCKTHEIFAAWRHSSPQKKFESNQYLRVHFQLLCFVFLLLRSNHIQFHCRVVQFKSLPFSPMPLVPSIKYFLGWLVKSARIYGTLCAKNTSFLDLNPEYLMFQCLVQHDTDYINFLQTSKSKHQLRHATPTIALRTKKCDSTQYIP